MAKGKRSSTEPFSVTLDEPLEGNASNGLPSFWTEYATAETPLGKVTIGFPAAGPGAFYIMLPRQDGEDGLESPPHLFIVKLNGVIQAAIGAAVERYQTGVNAPFGKDV